MRLTTSRLRAIRAVGHPNRAARYASTAIQHPDESVPEPVVKVPVVRELEGLYDILEGQVGGDVVWSERAMSALQRIEADHQVRVGVYSDTPDGVPSAAGNVVTALLLDPFSENAATTMAIQRRHDEVHTGAEFMVQYADETSRKVNSLTVPSPWLRDANASLVEITSRNPSEALSALLKTDTVILVLDPLRLFTSRLTELARSVAGKPMALVIDGALPGRAAPGGETAARQRILSRIAAQWRTITDLPMPEVHFLDSEAGITAIHALRLTIDASSPDAKPDFTAFQAPYLASNLGATSQTLLHALREINPAEARAQSAEHVASQAKGYVSRVIAQATEEALRVRGEAEELRAHAAHEAVGVGKMESGREERVREELGRARGEVEGLLKGVRVWGLGVEGVGEAVGRVVQGRWGQGIAQQLAFECGQLEQIHDRLSAETSKLLKSHASHGPHPAPFYSPLLMNQLSQLDRDARLTPSTLLPPIEARRAQLLISSVPAIQRRALRTTITGWSTTFLSVSASWTAAVPLDLIDAPTATGLGLLGGMVSLRWAVGAWAKAQRVFWRDWERVEQGLEEDLTRAVREIVQDKVVKKAVVGAEGLEVLVKRRMEKVDEVERALRRIGKER